MTIFDWFKRKKDIYRRLLKMTTSGMKVANIPLEEQMLHMPMKISDAAAMFRKKISPNEKPYQQAVLKANNSIVDRWYKEILIPLSDKDGCVPAGRVNSCLEIFLEGLEINQFKKYEKFMVQIPENVAVYWINFIRDSSIEELKEAGSSVCLYAWSTVKNVLRFHFAKVKWEGIFSQGSTPMEWDKLANNNPSFMSARNLPYGLSEEILDGMNEKVSPVIAIRIEPSK